MILDYRLLISWGRAIARVWATARVAPTPFFYSQVTLPVTTDYRLPITDYRFINRERSFLDKVLIPFAGIAGNQFGDKAG